MTDTEPTQIPTVEFEEWDQKNREYTRLANESFSANKTILLDVLAAAGITTVTVTFDGSGDSGQIGDIEAKSGDEVLALPSDEIEIASAVWGSSEAKRQILSISLIIETMAYDFLSLTHDGWENDDGAYGDFTFDVTERTITLGYNERRMASDYSQYVF